MIVLDEQQCQELTRPEPVAVDSQNKETYVLVRRDAYGRLKTLLDLEEYDPDEGTGFVNEVMTADDLKDPYLESYQQLGKSPASGRGLKGPSLVKCHNLATIRQRRVVYVLGHLSDDLLRQIDRALKASLELQ